jgi:putative aldouronate transport system substrate-binding protein
MQSRFLENRAGVVRTNTAATATLIEIMRETIPNVDFIGIPNLRNPADGLIYSTLSDLRQSFVNQASMITSQRNIDPVLRYLDWGYTPAGYEVMNWGELGVSFVKRDGRNYFTDEILNNPRGLPLDTALTRFSMAMCSWSIPKDPYYWVQATLRYPFQYEAIDNFAIADFATAMPPVSLTPDETRRFAQIMTDINTIRDETTMRVILGTDPITALDSMRARMTSLGIEEAIRIQQTALNRFNARR